MTRKDQRRIVREMLAGMRKTLAASLKEIPEDWDGFELRQLVKDTAELYCWRDHWRGKAGRRRRYNGVCAMRSLPRTY